MALNRQVPLAMLARHCSTTGERLVRETSRKHGMWTLAGPDRAIPAIPMRIAATGLRDIIAKHDGSQKQLATDGLTWSRNDSGGYGGNTARPPHVSTNTQALPGPDQ
ncbi:hypothetical protein [Streptomyces sp. YIM S03343]